MRAVAAGRGRPVVVANGAEGEPVSLKDKALLELAPHLVLDGAAVAAATVGADAIVVALGDDAGDALEAVEAALDERERLGVDEPRMSVVSVPSHYVAGQESALVNWINGGRAKPTFTPPMPFESGVSRRPTLVNNVETLAHLALIARHGPDWFRALGTAGHTGSALVTVSGPVRAPGVYEIECGAPLMSLIDAAGGATAGLGGALVGGYAGAWIAPGHLRSLALSDEHLAAHGAALGAGAVVLLSEHACPVAETARLARWMAVQSAGQCGPCVHGLEALATSIGQLAAGAVSEGRPTQRLERLAALTRRRGACGHPDGAVRMILSALAAFSQEFADHARHGPCDACARPTELPLPHRPVSDRAAREER
jgi:NADH:ubiquinone oxidoreductase subunit F (NADH-binding)